MIDKIKQFIPKVLKSVGITGLAMDKIMRIVYVLIVLATLNALHSLFSSDFSGDFAVFERDPETGKINILKFNAQKTTPRLTLNMLGVNYDSDLNKTVSYHRRVSSLWGFEFYAGVSVTQDKFGRPTYGVGVLIGF